MGKSAISVILHDAWRLREQTAINLGTQIPRGNHSAQFQSNRVSTYCDKPERRWIKLLDFCIFNCLHALIDFEETPSLHPTLEEGIRAPHRDAICETVG